MPKVSGEEVYVIGPKPEGWQGLGGKNPNFDTLVEYPDGEVGAVPASMIVEDAPAEDLTE